MQGDCDEKHFTKMKLYLSSDRCHWGRDSTCHVFLDTTQSVFISSELCSFISPATAVHYSGIYRECTSVENFDCKFPVSKQSFYFYLCSRVTDMAFHGTRSCTNKNTICKECFSLFLIKYYHVHIYTNNYYNY